jgi:hypothetical protein
MKCSASVRDAEVDIAGIGSRKSAAANVALANFSRVMTTDLGIAAAVREKGPAQLLRQPTDS